MNADARRSGPQLHLRLSACICGFSLLLAAQDCMILGKLRLASGQPIDERVRIELQSMQGVVIAVHHANTNGDFHFLNLGYGRFQLVLVSERYTALAEQVQLHRDYATARVTLFANARPEATPPTSGSPTPDPFAVSVKDLRQTYPARAVKDYEEGLKKAKDGKTEAAMAAYRRAIGAAPNFYLAHNNLGVLYMNAGQAEPAIGHFEQAIRLNDRPAQPFTNLGRIYLDRGDLERASQVLEQALRKDPASAAAHFLAGSVHLRLGKHDSAEALLKRCHLLDPAMARVHLQLANLYMRLDRRADLIAELEAFLREHPADPQASAVRSRLAALR
jgi:tetratricopeptide (TPR) repeat protein